MFVQIYKDSTFQNFAPTQKVACTVSDQGCRV